MTELSPARLRFVQPRVVFVLLLMLLVGSSGVARAQDASGAIPLADFQALIAGGVAEIEAADSPAAQKQALLTLQARLTPIDGVILENGDILHPDLSFLDPDDPDASLSRLRLLDSQLTLADGDATTARLAQLQATLQELGMEKVTVVEPRQVTTQPREFTGSGFPAVATLLEWGLMLAGGVLLIFILGSWLTGLLGGFVEDAELRRRQEDGDAPITARQAREMASEMARTGNYREAVRHLYLSALFKLEETGVTPRDRSKTNRELLAAVSEDDPVRQHLQPVVETFDRVWYGVREPAAAAFRHYEDEIEQLNRILSDHRSQPKGPTSAE